MGIYDVFDKFSIFNIIIGLILGIYLGFHHNDSELWLAGGSICNYHCFNNGSYSDDCRNECKS